jgi:enoyl-CoA hydratase
MTDEILAFTEGKVGRLRLNRPKAIHALNEPMCRAMIDALLKWHSGPDVELVLLDHAPSPDGDPKYARGFCAGGDVRSIAESGKKDGVAARSFFHTEYQLNHLLFSYAKTLVSFLDGIVMGGGVGIGLPAKYRVATERTMFAMPEATIGLFPDVGGGWYLSRLPGRIGQYLALTAARLNGADAHAIGLATHYILSDALEDVKAQLAANPRDAEAILDAASVTPPEAPILAQRPEIDRLFAADTLEEILAALEADPGGWAKDVLAGLRTKSPQSCKVALRLLRDGARRASFADEMGAEDNAPHWDPATPEGVTEATLDTIFSPLPAEQAWQPLRL